jgi:beta-glucanase (GH16 family)
LGDGAARFAGRSPGVTNADLDYIEAELRLTTSGGKYLKAWPPVSGHWANAVKRLESLRTVTPPPAPPSTPVPVGALLFEDDFNGLYIDTKKWEGKHYKADSGTQWSYLNQAALDRKGNLQITAVKVNGQWFSSFLAALAGNGFSYSGPRYLETRAKVPAGAGCFPAPLWEWASPWGAGPIEIDVCEQLGKEPTGYHTTVHPWLPSGDKPVGRFNDVGVVLSDDFHVYGAAVYPGGVDFYFDGEHVSTADMLKSGLNDLTTYPVVPCIDLDMGGWGGPVDPAITQASLLVDYVRVYRLA